MLRINVVNVLFYLLVLCGLATGPALGADILYIVNSATGADWESDLLIGDFLTGLGHEVTYFEAGESEADTEVAASAADLVYIGESVSSGAIKNEITDIETPMIVAEAWAYDEMGLVDGGGGANDATSVDIEIVNAEHFLAAGLSGSVAFLTSVSGADGTARFARNPAGSGATVIATSSAGDFIFVYEKGAALAAAPADGSLQVAADMRICLGFDYRAQSVLNDNAFKMIEAAVNYALGILEPPATARNPKPADGTGDLSRDGLVLSWTPGDFAATHNVYLGETLSDVNDAVLGSPLLISENQEPNTLALDRLDLGKTYYWRVDEVNGAPDKTVFKGYVWSLQVEPAGIPVVPITATASSSSGISGVQNTINGSGLDPNTGTHSTATPDMWMSHKDQDPNEPVTILYEFDQAYKLHEMTIWNSNQGVEAVLGFGIKEMVVTYSTDGTAWTRLGGDEGLVQLAQAPGKDDYAGELISLGDRLARYVKFTAISNWSQFFQQYSLSEVQFAALPTSARLPEPDSETDDVDPRTTVLSWRWGREASQHDVYVSPDVDALGSPTTVQESSIALNGLNLSLDTTYYWQVNEVNDTQVPSIWAGDLWSFTTLDSFVVDDFEGYNNDSPDRPFQTWTDGFGYSAEEFFPAGYGGNGTGAGIGHDIWSLSSPHYGGNIMETESTIAGSGQSMPFYYSNSGGVVSQTDRTFAVAQDWTVNGLQTLSIAFRGTPGNTGTLYIKINNTKIVYDLSATDIALSAWQAWNIDLTAVTGNLRNVTTLSFGVDGANASGMILIDDIRLYAEPGEMVTPEAPDSAGLLAQYTFEGNANDSSGNGLHGTLVNSQIVSPGAAGQGSAVQMTPGTYVDLGNPSALDFGTGDWTVAAWFKTGMTGTGDANKGTIVGKGGDSSGGHRVALIMSETTEGVVTLVCDDNATK
ncbi:MAG: hypothetical protein HQ515_22870, partial [Phycisphaeraceae bacterium]|nr:hypothetical protein [Phycisphaeraceae bacterium]